MAPDHAICRWYSAPGFRVWGVAVDLPIQDVLSINFLCFFKVRVKQFSDCRQADVRPMYVEITILLNVNMGGAESLISTSMQVLTLLMLCRAR